MCKIFLPGWSPLLRVEKDREREREMAIHCMKRLKRQNFQGSSIRFDWRERCTYVHRRPRDRIARRRQEQIFRENLSYHSMPFDVGGSLACWNVGTSLWMVFRERIPDIRGCGREEAEVVDSAEYKIVPCDRFEVQRTRNRVLLVPMIACPQRDLPLARALALIWGRRGGGGGVPGLAVARFNVFRLTCRACLWLDGARLPTIKTISRWFFFFVW